MGMNSITSHSIDRTLDNQFVALKSDFLASRIIYYLDVGDKFVRKLYEMTVNNEIESIDNDEIEKEIVI